MDRNQAIGFVLIAVLFIVYFQFFMEKPEVVDTQVPVDTTTVAKQPAAIQPVEEQTIPSDSAVSEQLTSMFGAFAVIASGDEKTERLENNLMTVDFNSKGGQVSKVTLKNYLTHDGLPLNIVEPERNRMSWIVNDLQGRAIDLSKLYYTIRKTDNGLSLVGDLGRGSRIVLSYELPEDTYVLKSSIKLEGLESKISSEDVNFFWVDRIKNQEKDVTVSRNNSGVKYYTLAGDFERIAERKMDFEEETIDEPIKWFSIKQKFFTAAIIPNNSFKNGVISSVVDESDTTTVKIVTVQATYPLGDLITGSEFSFFYGPNDFHIMSDVTEGFNKNLYLGWPPVNLVNRWILLPLFDLLSSFIGSYGIIIIIMVILIKLALSPLSYKSYLSMAKMKVLKPELDEIKERNKDDMSGAQKEQMALYRQVGVNPLSGCVPVILQMPILFAMFYFFPQAIELRQESFLWANDLSTYDAIFYLPFTIPGYGQHVSLFVLLMTASTILYTWSNNQVSSVQGPMKTFSYFMPLILMFVLNSFPAALSFYYFVSNLLTFGQQALIRRFVDEDKIRDVLQMNKKKNANKKKSTFQLKLEEAMKSGDAKKKGASEGAKKKGVSEGTKTPAQKKRKKK